MSFLNQLKNQAKELQTQHDRQHHRLEENTAPAEAACCTVQHYLQELAGQLNMIEPAETGFDIAKLEFPAVQVRTELLDELAKLIVSQPHRFV